MGPSSVAIALLFTLAIIPFVLWTAWMVHSERVAREAGSAGTPRQRTRRPPGTPGSGVADMSVGGFCEVAGSIGFAPSGTTLLCTASARGVQPRWRRAQTAA
jgi:hypothetical protein